ncbi:hypothetical protein HRbin14_02132 [bacterium HR14]|nr:hypothetical protein HRbin14_02132 [bacterium HR14]
MERDDVRLAQQRIQIGVGKAQHLRQQRVWVDVVRQHAHAKPAGNPNHMQADIACAHHAQRFPVEVKPAQVANAKLATNRLKVGFVQLARERKNQREGVFCHRVLAVVGHIAHHNPPRTAGF